MALYLLPTCVTHKKGLVAPNLLMRFRSSMPYGVVPFANLRHALKSAGAPEGAPAINGLEWIGN